MPGKYNLQTSLNGSIALPENNSLSGDGSNSTKPVNFQNMYLSQSPQPHSSLKVKKNNLMVYGYNQSNGNLNENLSRLNELGNGGQNIKSQKSIGRDNQINHESISVTSINNASELFKIKREQDRINYLLNYSQSKHDSTSLRTSSRNQAPITDSRQGGITNSQQKSLPSPLKYHNSYQLQPSTLNELQSFLNNNYYNNVQDNFNEKKRVFNHHNNNISKRTFSDDEQQLQNLESLQSHINNGQMSVSKSKPINSENKDVPSRVNIKATLDAGQQKSYSANYYILPKQKSKETKDQLNEKLQLIKMHLQSQEQQDVMKSKRDLKRPEAASKHYRQNNMNSDDYIDMIHDQVNKSFTEDKNHNKNNIFINSKHIRNRSEVKISIKTKRTPNQQLKSSIKDISTIAKKFSSNQKDQSIIMKFACKTRIGFIPNMKKTNQDSSLVDKNLGGIKGLWLLGIFDGHGVNGHLVSDFVKRNLPHFLSTLINGQNPNDSPSRLQAGKRKQKNKQDLNNFLPPLVNNPTKKPTLSNQIGEDVFDQQQSTNATSNNDQDDQTEQKWMISNPEQRDQQIKEAFKLTNEKLEYGTKIDSMFSGTTAVTLLLWNNMIISANAGDSRALLCSQNSAGIWSCTQLSRDHKPDEADEAIRIRKCNGRIEQSRMLPGMQGLPNGVISSNLPQFFGPKRVWLKHKQVPGLAMTRSLGDLVAKSVGVTYEPEIKVFANLTKDDKIIVIASDGLWDRIPNDEITRYLIPYYEKNDPEGAVQLLIREAADRWIKQQGMIDDITIIVAFIQPRDPHPQNANNDQSQNQNIFNFQSASNNNEDFINHSRNSYGSVADPYNDQKKNISRQKQVQIMLKEFQKKISQQKKEKQQQQQSASTNDLSLPDIKPNKMIENENHYKGFLSSANVSKLKLEKLKETPDHLSAYQDEEIDENSVLASSKNLNKNRTLDKFNQEIINQNKHQQQKRSKSTMTKFNKLNMLNTTKIQNTSMNSFNNQEVYKPESVKASPQPSFGQINEDDNKETQKEFFATFNPNDGFITTKQDQDQTQIDSTLKISSSQAAQSSRTNQQSQRNKKILMDIIAGIEYPTPGPGAYDISGTFAKQGQGPFQLNLNHRRQLSFLDYGGQSTQRSLAAESILKDGKFGLSFQNLKKQYFKEYNVELKGQHSPGPARYAPSQSDFNLKKHESKSMPREKRECPIVPKQHQQIHTSPFTYNNQFTSFQKHQNHNQYFGTKATRKIDITMFAQQHALAVRKGLF